MGNERWEGWLGLNPESWVAESWGLGPPPGRPTFAQGMPGKDDPGRLSACTLAPPGGHV
jgi:hypothetical protein